MLAAALHLGVVLGALAVLACLVVAGRPRTAEVLRDRTAWLFFGVPAVAGALFAVRAGSSSPGVTDISTPAAPAHPLGLGEIVKGLVTTRAEFYARQVIAQFGYGETTVSPAMIAVWYLLIAAVVVPALWRSAWRVRLAILGVVRRRLRDPGRPGDPLRAAGRLVRPQPLHHAARAPARS